MQQTLVSRLHQHVASRARRLRTTWPGQRARLVREVFPYLERVGLHLVENDGTQPVPDTRRLREVLHDVSELPGIDLRVDAQLALADEFARRFAVEYNAIPAKASDPGSFYLRNGLFESVDAEVLHSMIRRFQPRRIIEIGSGFSTLLALDALDVNRGDAPDYECAFVAIEPNPRKELIAEKRLSRLVCTKLEDVPIEEFLALGADDILFIDSSHVFTPGNDVWYEQLEILPRLQPGVVVHVHDIFLPEHYPARDLAKFAFPNEQYLLQAFLIHNAAYQVLWSANYLHLRHPDVLTRTFASYDRSRDRPGSFWMRKQK